MASPSSFPSVSTTEQDHPSSTSASGEAAEADIPPAETNSSFVDKEAKKSGAWIRYSIEWQDLNGKFKSRHVVEQPGAEVDELGDAASEMPAFEQVSVFQTKHGKDTNVDANLGVGAAPTLYLRIYSVAIIHALRSVVRYYPQQDLSGDIVEVTWPFPVLVHHFDELRDFREACIKKDQSEACIRERHVDTHVGLLLDFLNEELMDNVRSEKELTKTRHRTFDYLWASLKPGTTVYTEIREGPRWLPGVIHSVSGGIFSQERARWDVKMWVMKYDGKFLGRVFRSYWIEKFDGVNAWENIIILGDLDEFETSKSKHEVIEQEIEWGKIYWKLMKPQTKHHVGRTLTFPHNEVNGTVQVDVKRYMEETDTPRFQIRTRTMPREQVRQIGTVDLRDFISDCHCRVCSKLNRTTTERSPIFVNYDSITREDRPNLKDHQYFLCPNEVHAFVFRTRTWETVHVKNLSPPLFQRQMINNLVMDEKRRKTLTSLTASFARLDINGNQLPQEPWAADFVGGKGNGLIFLLHGGPGVGKTFTAECIANFLQRPLMVLTISDIGTRPEEVESILEQKFKTAKSWDAVLLIDEADVFLAKRSIEDLHRSSLVASFLRALEFYSGVLFLTTNRVGTFDDAILSRVHIQLFYPNLDNEQRHKIWMNFIKKLEQDRPSMQVKYAFKEFLRSSPMYNFEMNGREIRNAFQTAVALAEHRAEKGEGGKTLLTEDDLREVIELSNSFKTYFEQLHGSEGRRALDRGERLERPPFKLHEQPF